MAINLNKLRDNYECFYCLSDIQQTVSLNCQHKLCLDCAKEIFGEMKDGFVEKKGSCPKCRKVVVTYDRDHDFQQAADAVFQVIKESQVDHKDEKKQAKVGAGAGAEVGKPPGKTSHLQGPPRENNAPNKAKKGVKRKAVELDREIREIQGAITAKIMYMKELLGKINAENRAVSHNIILVTLSKESGDENTANNLKSQLEENQGQAFKFLHSMLDIQEAIWGFPSEIVLDSQKKELVDLMQEATLLYIGIVQKIQEC